MIENGELRLISDTGEQLGIMDVPQALALARERGLDLVLVSETSKPRVAKIMDFGKHRYLQKKKLQESKKKQKIVLIKSIKFTPRTDVHDYDFKLKHMLKFLKQGNKVKINIRFKGREMAHKELGDRIIAKLCEDTQDLAILENRPNFEGRNLVALFSPLKSKS